MKRQATFSGKQKANKQAKYAPVVRKDASDYRIVTQPKGEFKFTDFALAPTGITTSGRIDTCTYNMVAGTGWFNNFTGRTIDPVGLDFRFNIVGSASNAFAASDLNNVMRIMVFQWMDSSVPVPSGVLQVPTNPLSPILTTNYENINVLHDSIHSTWVSGYDTASGYANSNGYSFRVYIKRKKMRQIDWNPGTVDPQKGGLYILAISDSSVTPNPSLSMYSRLTYLN